MFSKLAFTLTTLLAAATAIPTGGSGTSQCNTGSPQCCQTKTTSSDPAWSVLAAAVGVVVQGVNVPVYATCSPLSLVGVGEGSSCNQNPVCCSNVYSSGLIAVGCTPINLNA